MPLRACASLLSPAWRRERRRGAVFRCALCLCMLSHPSRVRVPGVGDRSPWHPLSSKSAVQRREEQQRSGMARKPKRRDRAAPATRHPTRRPHGAVLCILTVSKKNKTEIATQKEPSLVVVPDVVRSIQYDIIPLPQRQAAQRAGTHDTTVQHTPHTQDQPSAPPHDASLATCGSGPDVTSAAAGARASSRRSRARGCACGHSHTPRRPPTSPRETAGGTPRPRGHNPQSDQTRERQVRAPTKRGRAPASGSRLTRQPARHATRPRRHTSSQATDAPATQAPRPVSIPTEAASAPRPSPQRRRPIAGGIRIPCVQSSPSSSLLSLLLLFLSSSASALPPPR